ncbi:hypothetical protein Gotur_024274 [Gossypium turneri]
MGNALRLLYGKCCKPSTTGDSDSVGPPYTTTAPGVSALAPEQCLSVCLMLSIGLQCNKLPAAACLFED